MNAVRRAETGRASPSEEARIREQAACWILGVREKDVERVLDYYAPDAVSFGLAPPLRASMDRTSRREALVAWFSSWDGPVDVEIRNLRLEISGDRAFAYSTNHMSGKRGGEPVGLWFRSTVGYRKIAGRWLIVHEHHSVPFDMVTLKACVDLVP